MHQLLEKTEILPLPSVLPPHSNGFASDKANDLLKAPSLLLWVKVSGKALFCEFVSGPIYEQTDRYLVSLGNILEKWCSL